MIAGELINDEVIPLRTSDSGDTALGIMSDFYIRHLPIVNHTELLGVLSEEDVLDHDTEEAVGSYTLSLRNIYVRAFDHIYEAFKLLHLHQLTALPVVDEDNQYRGMILSQDVIKYVASTMSITEPGGILVLEMSRRDYSLAEMAKIVESENANILSSYITPTLDHNLINVTLKINKPNLQAIISTFQRFKYLIKATYQETEFLETLKERYDSLMTYLDI